MHAKAISHLPVEEILCQNTHVTFTALNTVCIPDSIKFRPLLSGNTNTNPELSHWAFGPPCSGFP